MRSTSLAQVAIIDGHNDLPWAHRGAARYDLNRVALDRPQPLFHTDIPRLLEGGVKGQFWSVYVPAELSPGEAVTATLEQIDFVHRMVAAYPGSLALATTAAEARSAMASGRIASFLGAEGGHSIAESLGVLRSYHRLGVRYMTLTHNRSLSWADSATDEALAGGLSTFGEEVVREMNRLGMLVDLSHVAAATARAALAISQAPVIFSHSSCLALCDHPRNVPDDVLGLLSANGGIIMITFVPHFVSGKYQQWRSERDAHLVGLGMDPKAADDGESEALARWVARHPAPAVTVAQVADHVEHAREVAGLDHIGLGGDFDGSPEFPQGLEDVAGYPALLETLRDRGWSSSDLELLGSGNVLRVLGQAERRAAPPPR